MAVTATVFNRYKLKLIDSSTKISLGTDTIKLALLTSSWTPAVDTNEFWSDISTNEASGTGYTAGGFTLTTPATAEVNGTGAKFSADNVSWTITSTLSARYAALYKSTGVSSTSPLIGYIDLGSTTTLSSGTLTITFNASGVLTIS